MIGALHFKASRLIRISHGMLCTLISITVSFADLIRFWLSDGVFWSMGHETAATEEKKNHILEQPRMVFQHPATPIGT